MAFGDLPKQGQSLVLNNSLRQGLTAISVLAFISFFSSTILFSYLAYKLIWYLFPGKESGIQAHQQPKSLQQRVDFALGIEGIFDDGDDGHNQGDKALDDRRGSESTSRTANGTRTTPHPHTRSPPNQFLVLIFNLLLADMHQGIAFLTNAEWVTDGQIHVGTPTCFAQGLFVSLGDLASSCFITTIAVHTYLSVVRRYTIPHRAFNIMVVSVWAFVYLISLLPIAGTRNGAEVGGFFVRAGAWCWMNNSYSVLRLLTHYLFIFIGISTTTLLYTAIFFSLRRRSPNSTTAASNDDDQQQIQLSHNPAFLIYPVIYVVCTLPLAVGRIATMAGVAVPLQYMCFAGAMIAANGFFDCLLFGTTRKIIIFGSRRDVDRSGTGLDTFNFMQTPQTRRYGNMVWVQGGGGGGRRAAAGGRRGVKGSRGSNHTSATVTTTTGPGESGRKWPWHRLGGGKADEEDDEDRITSQSQESLRRGVGGVGGGIQMDTVTTVVVEREDDEEDKGRRGGARTMDTSSENTERF